MSTTPTSSNRGENGRLALNTAWMAVAQVIRAVVQAGYFVVIARALGANGYGAFVGAAALVAVLSPFATLGAGPVLVKNVARDDSVFAVQWGRCLLLAVPSAMALLSAVILISRFILPGVSLALVICVGLSDLLLARVTEIAGQAYQSLNWLARTAQLLVLGAVFRLVAALVLTTMLSSNNATTWSALYLSASMIACVAAIVVVNRELGSPLFLISSIGSDVIEGIYFSVGVSAQTIYNDIDKTMLASISSLEAAGVYAAAYRIVDTALTPIRSVLYSSYAQFFRHGSSGLASTVKYAKRLLLPTLAYSVVCGLVLYASAPIVPRILGAQYKGTGQALRLLSPLPTLKAMQYFAADALTGAGYQKVRSAVQGSVAVFNLAINLWLIRQYSWKGAVWSSLASDGLLVLLLWSTIRWGLSRDRVLSIAQRVSANV